MLEVLGGGGAVVLKDDDSGAVVLRVLGGGGAVVLRVLKDDDGAVVLRLFDDDDGAVVLRTFVKTGAFFPLVAYGVVMVVSRTFAETCGDDVVLRTFVLLRTPFPGGGAFVFFSSAISFRMS